jgi:hypothetical protein
LDAELGVGHPRSWAASTASCKAGVLGRLSREHIYLDNRVLVGQLVEGRGLETVFKDLGILQKGSVGLMKVRQGIQSFKQL